MNNRIRPIAIVGFGAMLMIGLSAALGNTAKAGDNDRGNHPYYGHTGCRGHRCGSHGRYPSYYRRSDQPSHSDSYGSSDYGGHGYQDGNVSIPAPTYPAFEAPATRGDFPPAGPVPSAPGPAGVTPSGPAPPGSAPAGSAPAGVRPSTPVPPGPAPPAVGGEAPRSEAVAGETVDFARDVRPILARYCFECHGSGSQASGLRLDQRQSAFKGGRSGKPAIVPGNSAASRMIQVVTGRDSRLQMPPDGSRLAANEIQTLRRWIDDGANWESGPTLGKTARTAPAVQAPLSRG
jgi:Planctomycete cytochrome C